MTASLVSLASQMNLDPIQAIALPTVISVASRKASMAESAMISEASHNAPLRDYLAGICNTTDVAGELS